jgi:hypothetical protein
MTDHSEIAWHREQIVKSRTLLEELEGGNTAGGDIFSETRCRRKRNSMRVALLALTLVVTSVAAAPAGARESQPCVLKATEALPHLTGLSVQMNLRTPTPPGG